MSESAADKGAKAKAAAAEKKAKAAAGASKPRAPKPADYTPRMKDRYTKSIRAKLKEEFKYLLFRAVRVCCGLVDLVYNDNRLETELK